MNEEALELLRQISAKLDRLISIQLETDPELLRLRRERDNQNFKDAMAYFHTMK